MAKFTATLLFAALASANYTTTAWMTKFGGSDKYGYVASVIDADAQHMTLLMDFDEGTDKDTLKLNGVDGDHTFGPSSYIFNRPMTRIIPVASGDTNIRTQCAQPAQPNDNVHCNLTIGEGYARWAQCTEYRATRTPPRLENTTSIYLHTYGTGLWGSGGVETITSTFNWPATQATTTPAWCTSDEVPASVLTRPYTTKAENFAVYKIVIVAGEEKLSAYSGSSVVPVTTSESTAPVSGATANTPTQSTGAAGKTNAISPAFAGMGVAALMGML